MFTINGSTALFLCLRNSESIIAYGTSYSSKFKIIIVVKPRKIGSTLDIAIWTDPHIVSRTKSSFIYLFQNGLYGSNVYTGKILKLLLS